MIFYYETKKMVAPSKGATIFFRINRHDISYKTLYLLDF